MSIVTQAMIFEKYGPRLGVQQLAELMALSPKTIYNQVSAKTFPVPTYVDGGARWADFRGAAAHFDTLRATAA